MEYKLYITIPLAQRSLIVQNGPDKNPYGFNQYGLDHNKILQAISGLECYGISLQRACGARWEPEWSGNRVDGSKILVYPAGPDENIPPIITLLMIKSFGYKPFMFCGWPKKNDGFILLEQLSKAGIEVGVDSSGGATNGSLIANRGLTVEPAPRPDVNSKPAWYNYSLPTYTSVARANYIKNTYGFILPNNIHIFWNGEKTGDKFYEPNEVLWWAKRGNPVHIPLNYYQDFKDFLRMQGDNGRIG